MRKTGGSAGGAGRGDGTPDPTSRFEHEEKSQRFLGILLFLWLVLPVLFATMFGLPVRPEFPSPDEVESRLALESRAQCRRIRDRILTRKGFLVRGLSRIPGSFDCTERPETSGLPLVPGRTYAGLAFLPPPEAGSFHRLLPPSFLLLYFHPEAMELRNGVDDDGDGMIDEGHVEGWTGERHLGFGDPVEICEFRIHGFGIEIKLRMAAKDWLGKVHRAEARLPVLWRDLDASPSSESGWPRSEPEACPAPGGGSR